MSVMEKWRIRVVYPPTQSEEDWQERAELANKVVGCRRLQLVYSITSVTKKDSPARPLRA